MSIEIKAPTFPESVADGTIANWIKKEGDSVNQDEVIAEIETDKVVLEVLAQSNGVVSKILKTEGVTGFYKGLSANLLRAVPNSGIQFSVYSALKYAMQL